MRSSGLPSKLSYALLAAGMSAFVTMAVSPLLFIGSAARSAKVHKLPFLSAENAYAALPLFGVAAGISFFCLLFAALARRDG